jgi:hypothetical protein
MVGSDEDCGRSRRPSAEDRRWSSTGQVLIGRAIGRSGDTVCGLHRARGDEECGFLGSASKLRTNFLVEPQYQGRISWLSLKIKVNGFPVWALKPAALVW